METYMVLNQSNQNHSNTNVYTHINLCHDLAVNTVGQVIENETQTPNKQSHKFGKIIFTDPVLLNADLKDGSHAT